MVIGKKIFYSVHILNHIINDGDISAFVFLFVNTVQWVKLSTDYNSELHCELVCFCDSLALTSHRPSHHHLACACLWSPLSLVLSPSQTKDACARAIDTLNIIYKTVSVESTVISHVFWEWCAFLLYLNYFYISSLSTFLKNNMMTNTFY